MYAFFLVYCPADAPKEAHGSLDSDIFAGGILQDFPGAAAASFELAPVSTILAASYVAAHFIACVVLRWYPHKEMLPFSCFPMFKNALDLFDPVLPYWHRVNQRSAHAGTVESNRCHVRCHIWARPHEGTPRSGVCAESRQGGIQNCATSFLDGANRAGR